MSGKPPKMWILNRELNGAVVMATARNPVRPTYGLTIGHKPAYGFGDS